ncbi:MAG: isoamylase [Methylococcales bacterium]
MSKTYAIQPGSRLPLGASWTKQGTNFAITSREASGFELLLYKSATSPEPFQTIQLDPKIHRSIFSWHVFVEKLSAGTYYNWRIHRIDGSSWIVLDPYAHQVSNASWQRGQATSTANCLRGIINNPNYDHNRIPAVTKALESAVIYELHVGGFTSHQSSGVKHPGTFTGLIEKIPYLQALGVTHVELLPVMAFDNQDVPANVTDLGLDNYWGYSSYGFFAPHPGYCATKDSVKEFRDLVKAFHEAGLAVILDVVFNHTSESGVDGPVIHFKALAKDDFYHRDPENPEQFRDYTGCGNTVNCNHPLVTHYFVDCLEYWVKDMHVDGFRFDLASVFARGEDGKVLKDPSLPWSIELSPALVETPVIAEAWDAAGLYQVGSFPGARWSEWNGRYRDAIRRFVRGDKGLVGLVATCMTGSSDLYSDDYRFPSSSINFITCHDGFTLWDLVSYNNKYNAANGENNRDGCNNSLSWNCGIEGETDDPVVLALRHQQVRNFIAILLLSQGVPMLLAGDELLHSQGGNNNAWCQDNEISWLNWQRVAAHQAMHRFVREFIAFRHRHACLSQPRYLTGQINNNRGLPDISWHGLVLNAPLWQDPDAQILAFTLTGCKPDEEDVHVMLNMSNTDVNLSLPEMAGRTWHLAVDTAALAPADIIERKEQKPLKRGEQLSTAHSIKVFEAR